MWAVGGHRGGGFSPKVAQATEPCAADPWTYIGVGDMGIQDARRRLIMPIHAIAVDSLT